MREEHVQVTMPDGIANGFVYAPDGAGPWPAVLYYPHGLGIDAGFHQMATRVAGEGYVVLLPNIFYRTTTGPALEGAVDFKDPRTRARLAELMGPLTPDAMASDAIAYLDFLGAREDVRPGPMGVVGYCFTGKMALRTAAAAPTRVAAAASFHGGGLYTAEPSSPHHVLPLITARLYFGHATDDQGMPADAIAGFEAALAVWGGVFESETYPARHGWTVPGGHVYDHDEAERHFVKLKALFAETLR